MKKPIALIIMDGVGLAPASAKNAVSLSATPRLNDLIEKYPHIQMRADGLNVGLPKGQMGNSEVGHMNIGAGRVVFQSLTRIDNAIKDGSLKMNKSLDKAVKHAKEKKSKIHIIGLISDGGVHSHISHIIELYNLLKKQYDEVYVHGFTDGRDVGQKSAKTFVDQLTQSGITLASIGGRYYGMDRDKRWEREQLAYDSLTQESGPSFNDANAYIDENYAKEVYDEFLIPAYNENLKMFIKSNDSIVFANFRPDRARQLAHMFLKNSKLYDYKPKHQLENIYLTTMMTYAGIDVDLIFPSEALTGLIGETIANSGKSQLRAAETEKYPHVTFFLDGGKELDFENELKILVNSPKVATYDLQPEMSAIELTDKIVKNIENFDAAIINYANGDMVGHSGSIPATIKAVETVDTSIGRIYDKVVTELGGVLMITADHGNADEMIDEFGDPMTKHSTNPVPLIITSKEISFKKDFEVGDKIANLSNLAPTMLKLLDIKKPKEMTSESLINKN